MTTRLLNGTWKSRLTQARNLPLQRAVMAERSAHHQTKLESQSQATLMEGMYCMANGCISCVLMRLMDAVKETIAYIWTASPWNVSYCLFDGVNYPHQHTADAPVCLLPCRCMYGPCTCLGAWCVCLIENWTSLTSGYSSRRVCWQWEKREMWPASDSSCNQFVNFYSWTKCFSQSGPQTNLVLSLTLARVWACFPCS